MCDLTTYNIFENNITELYNESGYVGIEDFSKFLATRVFEDADSTLYNVCIELPGVVVTVSILGVVAQN